MLVAVRRAMRFFDGVATSFESLNTIVKTSVTMRGKAPERRDRSAQYIS